MLRKLMSLTFVLAFGAAILGCHENEHKRTVKEESQTESAPQDTSPGEMIVE